MTLAFHASVLGMVAYLAVAKQSYVQFEFEIAGEPQTFHVSEGVDAPYMVTSQEYFSKGFSLLPGQMLFTDARKTGIPMPKGDFAILGLVGDIAVDSPDGNGKAAAPLNECYDHHWIVMDYLHKNELCPYGPNYVFGIGAESRNDPVNFPKGTGYVVRSGDAFGANIHLLRTDDGRDLAGEDVHMAIKECNECYYAPGKGAMCTAKKNGTFQCCGDACYDGSCSCPTKPGTKMEAKTYYLRYTLNYTRDLTAITPIGVGTYTTPDCAAFYDVLRNDEQPYSLSTTTFEVAVDAELLYAQGHQHVGGRNISLFHNEKFVCASYPTYGTRHGVPGDELGYLVAMSECFNKDSGVVLHVEKGDKIRLDSWYYVGSDDPVIAPSVGGTHLNVMGYMYTAYKINGTVFPDSDHGPLPTAECQTAFHRRCSSLLGMTGECIACLREHSSELKAAGCSDSTGEAMCQFMSPRGGMMDGTPRHMKPNLLV